MTSFFYVHILGIQGLRTVYRLLRIFAFRLPLFVAFVIVIINLVITVLPQSLLITKSCLPRSRLYRSVFQIRDSGAWRKKNLSKKRYECTPVFARMLDLPRPCARNSRARLEKKKKGQHRISSLERNLSPMYSV